MVYNSDFFYNQTKIGRAAYSVSATAGIFDMYSSAGDGRNAVPNAAIDAF